MVGCGKEKAPDPVYTDGNVSVTEVAPEENKESTTGVLTNDEWSVLQDAPRNEYGTFDTAHLTEQQLEIYEKMQTNKFIDFTDEEALSAVQNFFSSNIETLGYKEYASVSFDADFLASEEGKDFGNVVYSATVEDRRTDMHITGDIVYYITPNIVYENEVFLNRNDGYYYTFMGESLSEASSIMVRDADLYELFNDLEFLFSNVTDLTVTDSTYNGYVCEFTVAPELIVKSSLLNKQYANVIFQDYGQLTKGVVYINTETKQIDKVELTQLILNDTLKENIETLDAYNELKEVGVPLEAVTYTVGYEFQEYNETYNYVIEDRETAEILEAYYMYLVEHPEEAQLLGNGGTEHDIQQLHKDEAQKEAERQMLEQLEQQEAEQQGQN